jgi:hypothetical protein
MDNATWEAEAIEPPDNNSDTIRPPFFCGGYGALGGPMKFFAAPAFLVTMCIATPTQAADAAVWVLW